MSATYRPHLDGIRAVAVVMVLLFHLGYAWIPGGFIGVDVFFVLSGYLITGLLLGEAERTSTIGLRRFYARRARRLLPASVAVLVAVMAVGRVVMDPIQKVDLGIDVTWSALYAANWRFALAGGDYFAPGDVPSPVVHYWSLAVEEQFYLLWPALFLGLHRSVRRLRPEQPLPALIGAVGVLAVASAVASVVLVGTPVAYYGTHTRAYQLLAGGLLALIVRHGSLRLPDGRAGQGIGVALSVAAGLVLAWEAHTIPDATDYPGVAGLVVTAASLALIVGVDLSPPGPASAVLGHAAPAALGRLSYSVYIWHWPVIVLAPLVAEHRLEVGAWYTTRAGMVAVIAALAGGSYLLVERPLRFRLLPGAPPLRVVGVGLLASLAVAGLAYPLHHTDDPLEQKALRAVRDLAEPAGCPYFAEDWPAPDESEPCVLREGDGPVVAIVGDSHAQQWQPALLELAEESDATILRATRGGCPANDVTAYARDETGQNVADTDCTRWRHRVYPMVAAQEPDVVLVATRSHVRGIRVGERDVAPSDPDHLEVWSDGWAWSLDTLAETGATVVVSEILPTLPERVPACLIRAGDATTTACDFPVDADEVVPPYNAALAAAVEAAGVEAVDPTSIACPGGTCPALMEGTIVHRDDNHLSATFVREQAAAVGALLASVGATI